MKKLLVLLGILAAFSFVACNKEAEGTSDPETNIENEDTGDVTPPITEDEGSTTEIELTPNFRTV